MNKDQLLKILQKLNITPTKSKGQNFLMDEQVVLNMVEKATVGKEDLVLEVGPGLGVLTEVLAEKALLILLSDMADRQLASATISSSVICLYPVRAITSLTTGFSWQKLPLNMVMIGI